MYRIPSKEFEAYKQEFAKGGMHGPLCYYRNALTRYEEEKGWHPLLSPKCFPINLTGRWSSAD